MPIKTPIEEGLDPSKDGHGSEESESGGGFSRSPSVSGYIRETDLSPEERVLRFVLGSIPVSGYIRETDLPSEERVLRFDLVVSLRSGLEGSHPPDKSVPPDVTPEKEKHKRLSEATLKDLARHFAQQAGEIKSLLYKAEADPEREQSFIRQAAIRACRTLKEVLEDENLREGIKLLALTRQHLEVDEVVPIVRDIEGFFKEEENLLVECGASGDPVAEIIADCRRVFEDVRNGRAPRGQVFEAIERITRETCDLKERLKEQASQERKLERGKKILKTAGKAMGGAAVVALNAGILTIAGKQAFAAFSEVLGAGLIEAAAQEL